MATVTFYYDSVDDASFTVTGLGTNASYPTSNLSDRNKNVYFKAGNANTSGYINIDLGSTRKCDSLILGNHNYTSTSVGIKLASDDNDNGSYSAVTYHVGSSGAYHDYASDGVNWLETFTETTKRYWRLYLEAMGAGTYQQIATIFLGPKFEHSVNWNYGDGQLGHKWGVEVGQTSGGIKRRQKNHGEQKSWNYNFQYIDETHRSNFLTFLRAVYGNFYPFFFADESSNLYYASLINSEHIFPHLEYQMYNIRTQLEEEL